MKRKVKRSRRKSRREKELLLFSLLPIILRSQKISQDAVGRETSAQDVVDVSSWLIGGWLGLPRRRAARSSGGDVVAVRPVRPQGGCAAVAISDGSARETIGDGVIFAVYMADMPYFC